MRRICMVGTGGIATQHMRAFAEIGGVHPCWAVSRLADEGLKFANEWNFEHAGTNLGEALADASVDLVLIASPSDVHAEQALQSLRAGKDVIIEIPVALNLAEAESVSQCARDLGRRAMVCHTMRSFPAIREIRRRVRAGELHISQIDGFFAIPRRRNQSWAGQRHWIDNLLWHHACHQVDAALWVLGVPPIEHVSCMIGQRHPQFGMAMDVSLHFHTTTRQLVTQALTYNAEHLCWELRFIGDEDVLIFRTGHLLDETNQAIIPEKPFLDLVAQNSEMLAALGERRRCDYDIEEVLPAMFVLHEAQKSADERM
jgi:2-hydroxy-4-carboxymuconate semialdehyde hemiacetal dehydrogenase